MNLAIIFGGNSFEHEISIVSAITIKHRLKQDIQFIFCDAFRNFYLIPSGLMRSNTFSSKQYLNCKEVFLFQNNFKIKSLFANKELNIDIVLNLIHGQDGEDGKISSLFDFYNIKYIGPRVEASVLSYNKILTKQYALMHDVETLKYNIISAENENIDLSFPIIVKPATAGSSIGISIVKSKDELRYALDSAYEFDKNILIEPFISGVKEYNLAGYKANGKIYFSKIEEPIKDEILDFDAKYLNFSQTTTKKANITDIIKNKLEEVFSKIYNTTFDGAIIRCDFFLINNIIYLNEINPVPGSLANYLFDNFESDIENISKSIKNNNLIDIDYEYINKITKGSSKNP